MTSARVAYPGIRQGSEGVCEIWLTSEDTGAYGRDIGTDLPSLLWELVKEIPEGAMLRLGMTNPPYILEHLEEMAKILNHPRVYAFLHVPVQSASDSVLMDMKREYCCDDFRRVVDFLKEKPSAHHGFIVTSGGCGERISLEMVVLAVFALLRPTEGLTPPGGTAVVPIVFHLLQQLATCRTGCAKPWGAREVTEESTAEHLQGRERRSKRMPRLKRNETPTRRLDLRRRVDERE
ncbi:threonylcarbamoyladenosine tRNA methylthiotransferase [Labeo rohita]|uniref:Threonylcarbamoyladenosine tRNA methylthiotransferase n=1 Tax=Labeo rohita TaxID=84645 RepID=A0A498M958_LABRO|nr:threonylcarbamoyladenosine tRNA methylthiotransferase [Labeo rohita]